MSILSALARAYERLPDRPELGYSMENVDFVIPLSAEGVPGMPIDLRKLNSKKKLAAERVLVPQPPKRASGIAACFLRDKSAYVLGIGSSKRLEQEHEAFVELHREALADSVDPGLRALVSFLDGWVPVAFEEMEWPEDIRDANIAFTLKEDWRLHRRFLHQRPAAQEAWEQLRESSADERAIRCLVSGRTGSLAVLHPSIKGVWGAQSAGASIVSFNLRASESYGHKQGANAPVNAVASFRYTTVLNRFLERNSGHRVQIGDTSCVFWAEADDDALALQAELLAGGLFGAEMSVDPQADAEPIGSVLDRIAAGVPVREAAPELAQGVRFYVLGLAPNAARLSVRFWFEDSFGTLLERWQQFWTNLRVEPTDGEELPAMWKYLPEVAVLRKRENVPPRLSGDWFQAVLRGERYPQTLLTLILVRIRADGLINTRRASILRAMLVRNYQMNKEAPVALDPENRTRGYRLGRLFAIYEEIQRAALGGKVNATIKDKYYGAASARPLGIFPVLDRGAAHHMAKLGKTSPGRRVNLDKLLASVMESLSPDERPFPATLPLADQALFALGYYHQRSSFYSKSAPTTDEPHDEMETVK